MAHRSMELLATARSLELGQINRLIDALPDAGPFFPAKPRWMDVADWIGGSLLGLVLLWPALLWLGLSVEGWVSPVVVAFLAAALVMMPPTLWRVWHLVRNFRRGVGGFFMQMDHDLALLRSVADELALYPAPMLQRCLAEARFHHAQLGDKLRLLLGGMEKLGVLPLVVAVFLAVGRGELPALVPVWAWALGIGAALLWLIGWIAARFRLRLNLVAHVLEQALAQQAVCASAIQVVPDSPVETAAIPKPAVAVEPA